MLINTINAKGKRICGLSGWLFTCSINQQELTDYDLSLISWMRFYEVMLNNVFSKDIIKISNWF